MIQMEIFVNSTSAYGPVIVMGLSCSRVGSTTLSPSRVAQDSAFAVIRCDARGKLSFVKAFQPKEVSQRRAYEQA